MLNPNIDTYCFSEEWLNNRMLFISGPRQVGKTTYAQNKIKKFGGAYFNWDRQSVRSAYAKNEDFFVDQLAEEELLVFDEIHKIHNWKNILKGTFDEHRHNYKFLVTGSARLDTFRRSGDSLVGRYFLTHLLPISSGDLLGLDFCEFQSAETLINTVMERKPKISQSDFDNLLILGGFPEPYYRGTEKFAKQWSKQHQELLVREDLRDLSRIVSLDKVETLVDLLKVAVCEPISYNSFAKTLEVNHNSIKQWLLGLEKIMLCFSIRSWSKKISRTISRAPKIYFYNWASLADEGARFENFVASQLMKACTLWNDRFATAFELHYIQTYDEQEVDFLISLNSKPWLLIEAKHGKPDANSALYRFREELKVPAIILSNEPNWNIKKQGVSLISARRFFEVLP